MYEIQEDNSRDNIRYLLDIRLNSSDDNKCRICEWI